MIERRERLATTVKKEDFTWPQEQNWHLGIKHFLVN